MGISKKGKLLIVVVTLCISLPALDQSQAAVEKYTMGAIKEGIAFVSARFVSKAFGAMRSIPYKKLPFA